MLKKILLCLSSTAALMLLMLSCGSQKLVTNKVAYQSVRTTKYYEKVPGNAKIAVAYAITPQGELIVNVFNKTAEVMIIDQTLSFFVDTDGKSYSYYDPTIRTTTNTSTTSSTEGASVNLGAIGRTFGIGGTLGSLLGGVNVGGAETVGSSVSNTTYFADQPQIALGPGGSGVMSDYFSISNWGENYLNNVQNSFVAETDTESPSRFSVCIAYSIDGGDTFEKLVTKFYVNSQIIKLVKNHGEVNNALQDVYRSKPDALYEPCWLLYFGNNINNYRNVYDSRFCGTLIDFK